MLDGETGHVVERFWEHHDRSPGAAALVDDGGEEVTRAALAQLAAALRSSPAVRGAHRVTIVGEQSLRLVSVIAATHLIGREFSVVSAVESPEVRRSQVAALHPEVVVDLTGDDDLAAPDLPVLRGDDLFSAAGSLVGAAEPSPFQPAAHAYTVHTSGSTGHPKLVQMSRNAFDQYVEVFVERYDLGTGARLSVWAAPTYDAHHCQLFSALASGAVGVVAGLTARRSGTAVLEWLRDRGITHFETTPSILRALVAAARAVGLPPGLVHIMCSGERFEPELARAVFDLTGPVGGRVRLTNEYGPTECVLATWHEITSADLDLPDLPVGAPIPGRQVDVDPPPGAASASRAEPGEVVIRSRHLCAGYGIADGGVELLSADEDGVITYRTGDLGYVDERGLLRLAGRRDRTIKRRGVKIALDDVERAFAAIPYVEAVAALAEPDGAAVAVWAVSGDAHRTEDDLRADVAATLAAASLPERITLVDALPRLHSGKVDYRALPSTAPAGGHATHDRPGSATGTGIGVMRELARVLRRPVTSPEADFFALGGHSLLALDLAQRIADRFGVTIGLADILRHPKAGSLAELVDRKCAEDGTADPAATSPVALTAAERPIWTWSQLFPHDGAANVVAGFRTGQPLTDRAIGSAVERLVRQTPQLRLVFPTVDGRPHRVVRNARSVDLRALTVAGPVGDCDRSEVREAFYQPFDITGDQLVRVVVVRSSDSPELAVCVVVHHIACDGIGLAELIDHLRSLLLDGAPPPPPDAPAAPRTADAAAAARTWRGVKDRLRTLPYLGAAGASTTAEPVEVATFTVAAAPFHRVADAEGIRLPAILVEAVAEAVLRAGSADAAVVETPVSLRTAGQARAIGNFVVDVPVVVSRSPARDRPARRRQVAADLLGAIEAAPTAPGFGGLRPGQGLAPAGDAVVVLEHRAGDRRDAAAVRIPGSPPRNPVAVYVTAEDDTLAFRVLSRVDPNFAQLVGTHLHSVVGDSAGTPAGQEHTWPRS